MRSYRSFQHMNMQNESKKIRPKGKKTRFYIDNELLEYYGNVLKPHGIAIYSVLAKHANSKSQECFPSYETIMKQTGIGKRNTVSKYLKLLKSLGLIEMLHKKGFRSNQYRLLSCGDDKTRSIQKDTGRFTQQASSCRIPKEGESYPIQHVSSILKDTLTHRMKSDKEVTSSFEKEPQTSIAESRTVSTDAIRDDLIAKGKLSPRKSPL